MLRTSFDFFHSLHNIYYRSLPLSLNPCVHNNIKSLLTELSKHKQRYHTRNVNNSTNNNNLNSITKNNKDMPFGEYIGHTNHIKSSSSRSHTSSSVSRPYVIGLCGGIAAGKSGISSFLSTTYSANNSSNLTGYNVILIDCDVLGHNLLSSNSLIYNELMQKFGKAIVDEDNGHINRGKFSNVVFNNVENLKYLNSIAWPAIQKQIQEIIVKYSDSNSNESDTSKRISKFNHNIIIVDAAALIEAGWHNLPNFLNEIWVVSIDRENAITRLATRNKLSREAAETRINSQMSNEERMKHADVVLSTLFPVEQTREFVRIAFQKLIQRIEDYNRISIQSINKP